MINFKHIIFSCFLVLIMSCKTSNSKKATPEKSNVPEKEVVSQNEQTIDEFLTILKSAFATNDLDKVKSLSTVNREDVLNKEFIQYWNAPIQDVTITKIEESLNIPGAIEFSIEKEGQGFIFIIKMQDDNTYKLVDFMGIG